MLAVTTYALRKYASNLGGAREIAIFLGEGGLALAAVLGLGAAIYGLVKKDLYGAVICSVLFLYFAWEVLIPIVLYLLREWWRV